MIEIAFFVGGYLVQLAGTALLVRQIILKKSVYGLSLDAQICQLIATIARCVWSMDTRLLETRLSYLEMAGSVIVNIMATMLCFRLRKTTTRRAPMWLNAGTLTGVCLLLAVFIHPGYALISLQILVALTIYLEAAALLPQIYMMRKLRDADGITGTYTSFLAASRVIRLAFWLCLHLMGDSFKALLIADLIHTFLCTDYAIIWYRKIRKGGFGLIHEL